MMPDVINRLHIKISVYFSFIHLPGVPHVKTQWVKYAE